MMSFREVEGCRTKQLSLGRRRGRAALRKTAGWWFLCIHPGTLYGRQAAFQPHPFVVGLARETGTLAEVSKGDLH